MYFEFTVKCRYLEVVLGYGYILLKYLVGAAVVVIA
jgi:hypothetical protein